MIKFSNKAKFAELSSLRFQKESWINKGYHGVLFLHSSFMRLPAEKVPGFKNQHRFIIDSFHGERGFWYWNHADMVAMRDELIEKVNKDKKFFYNFVVEWRRRLENLKATIKLVDSANLTDLSNKKLGNLFEKFDAAYMRHGALAFIVPDSFSMTSEEFLLPHFQRVFQEREFEDKATEYFELLTSPTRDSFLSEERKELLKLAIKIKNPAKLTDKETALLKKHAQKYFWIENNYARIVKLDWKYFLEKIQLISKKQAQKELNTILTRSPKLKAAKKRLITQLKLALQTKNLIELTEVFAYIQDERKRYALIVLDRLQRFLEEFAKRLHLTQAQAKWLNVLEIQDLLNGRRNIDVADIKQRQKKCFLLSLGNGTIYQLTGKEADHLEKLLAQKPQKRQYLEGMIASKGMARGSASVIYTIKDLSKMRRGNILITSMTRPEMVSAMHLAGAIVTDEGGITSHAAIVSREMRKPCIIGTKIATEVFKDGDMVEVDANRGIVRKL